MIDLLLFDSVQRNWQILLSFVKESILDKIQCENFIPERKFFEYSWYLRVILFFDFNPRLLCNGSKYWVSIKKKPEQSP